MFCKHTLKWILFQILLFSLVSFFLPKWLYCLCTFWKFCLKELGCLSTLTGLNLMLCITMMNYSLVHFCCTWSMVQWFLYCHVYQVQCIFAFSSARLSMYISTFTAVSTVCTELPTEHICKIHFTVPAAAGHKDPLQLSPPSSRPSLCTAIQLSEQSPCITSDFKVKLKCFIKQWKSNKIQRFQHKYPLILGKI